MPNYILFGYPIISIVLGLFWAFELGKQEEDEEDAFFQVLGMVAFWPIVLTALPFMLIYNLGKALQTRRKKVRKELDCGRTDQR